MVRLFALGAMSLLVCAAIIVAIGFGYRAWRQHEAEEAAVIDVRKGIDEAYFIPIGGSQQWITIRGQDRSNPILLMLDGGPGVATSPFLPSPLETDFVVVKWDQPGTGRTFGRASGVDHGLTIEKVVNDGLDVAQYLRKRLHREKIGLLATSWGTVPGIGMIKARPDLFYAYVGSAQIVNMKRGLELSYRDLVKKARARRDRAAITDLESIGPPPQKSDVQFRTQLKWSTAYEAGAPSNLTVLSWLVFAPRYKIGDVRNWISGFLASQDTFFGKTLNGPLMAVDLPSMGTDFAVPIFFFQGTEDDRTPFSLVQDYFATIQAPQKTLVPVSGAGHYVEDTHPEVLRKLLDDHVRPLGNDAGSLR